jgi:hypothetical protein
VIRLLIAAALLSASAPLSAQSARSAAPDYSRDADWLCLPGRSDSCSTPLPTTELTPAGYGTKSTSMPAKDPPIDCFYVYPTVSTDPGMNADMSADAEEKGVTEIQFARFASVCRPFVPIYRQMTVSAIVAFTAGAEIKDSLALAYRDVLAAWRQYIARRNNGRPFVLIGHSQGSLMIQLLIAREIENNPALASRMKLAIIPGFNLFVPPAKLVGGTLKKTPLCSRPGETGCVMAWNSFREKNVPPAGAMFGYSDQPGMTVACVNPALPGSRDWIKLDSYWFTRSDLPVPGGPILWSTQGQPSTPFVHTNGLVSGRCVNDGPRGYLSIRTNHAPGDKWTDHIGGEVAILGMFLPGWGMHLDELFEAQGDLLRDVGAISAQSRTAARH